MSLLDLNTLQLPGTRRRDITVFPEAEEVEGVLVLRIESALFYACILPVRDWVRKQASTQQADLTGT